MRVYVVLGRPLIQHVNPFHATGLFLNPMKTSENLWFSDAFRGYKKRPVPWIGLTVMDCVAFSEQSISKSDMLYIGCLDRNWLIQNSNKAMSEIARVLITIEALVQRCSVKEMFLEISQNSLENSCARASF